MLWKSPSQFASVLTGFTPKARGAESREGRGCGPPARQTPGVLLLTLPNLPHLPPGRAFSCSPQQGAPGELCRLRYLRKKLMVAATAVLLFLSGNLQGHFKVKRNLSLQQVPKSATKPGLSPGQVGFARDPAPRPNSAALHDSEGEECSLGVSLHLPGKPGQEQPCKVKEEQAPARGAERGQPLLAPLCPLPWRVQRGCRGSTRGKARS